MSDGYHVVTNVSKPLNNKMSRIARLLQNMYFIFKNLAF